MKESKYSVILIGAICMAGVTGSISASAIEAGKTAELMNGDYVGGVDIPAGTYTLKCETGDSEYGIVWLSSPEDNLEEEYPSMIYENVSFNEESDFFISLEEGGTLHVPFSCKLTAVDYSEGNVDALYAGSYIAGKDLPEGKYLISYETDADHSGIIWLSEAGDNLEEEYPSMLYEYISFEEKGSYFISLKEGRHLYLPVTFDTVEVIDDFDFENGAVDLYPGQYVIGEDLLAGTYEIKCLPEGSQDSGILWASAPGDNLDEEYPSLLYEFVNSEESFRVSVEDGSRICLPVHCCVSKTTGGVVFN